MNITKYITEKGALFGVLCSALFFSSCVREGAESLPGPGAGESVRVEILLHAPESGPQTRALTESDECRVDDVLVLFFMQDGMQLHSVAEGRKLSPEPDGRAITFETSFSVETKFVSKEFACIVLANVAGQYDYDTRLSWRGMTYGALQQELRQAVKGKLYTSSPSSMAMWGRAAGPLVPSQSNPKLSVPLLRSVARVDVSLAAEVSDFILDEVQVWKPNDALSLMPELSAYVAADPKVSAPSVPAGAAPLADNWVYTVQDNRIDYSTYIPEADVLMGGEGVPGDANHTNRCALVVGGRYPDAQSPVTYYRIDFKQGGAEPSGKLMDVLRNHRYNVRITQVLGRGEESPTLAYEARTAEITAEVIPWTDNNQDIVFDGANWASVGRKRMDFGDGMGAEELLSLLSSVKPSQWSMQFSLPDGTPTSVESRDQSVKGRYFEVVKPHDLPEESPEQGGYLTVRTLQALPEYSDDSQTTKNTTLHERLTVRIGKLELVVDLYQHPYSDTEWDDGGDINGSV